MHAVLLLAFAADELGTLRAQVETLTAQYAKLDEVERKANADRNIADGELYFLLGDYVRAGVVLYDVVEERANAKHKLYDLALYYLGESSFQTRNFYHARTTFTTLLLRGNVSHQPEAFSRLVEIGDILGDWTGLDALVKKGKPRPDVAYVYGKSLVRRARDSQELKLGVAGITQLLTIEPTHKYYGRARYAIGVELLRQKRYDEAITEFRRTLALRDPLGLKADGTPLRELCLLAIARIHGDRGRVKQAVSTYLSVDKKSPLMPQVLYELGWLYAANNDLRKSLQMIDLLMLTPDDPRLIPQAKVLKANVLLKLKRYNEANDAFIEVGKIYEPVYQQITRMPAPDPSALPGMAAQHLSGEREVARALAIQGDLKTSHASIDEAKAIAARLRGTPTFPQLKEGDARALELDGKLAALAPSKGVTLLREKIRSLRSLIAGIAKRRSDETKAAVARETRAIEGYERELKEQEGEAQRLTGRVARDAFEDVKRKFYTLAMKADVGVIDVAWARKEDETNDINALVKAHKIETEAVDQRYGEALRE